MQAALEVTGSMLDMVIDRMCVQHDCGYSTTCPGCWCIVIQEKKSLEEEIERATRLIEHLQEEETDHQPEG